MIDSQSSSRGTPDAMKLIYFDIPGKAEAIRLCAAVAGVPLEDVRITREAFAEMKASGALPYGQVPALDLGDGKILAQSSAILRYVATVGGLHPTEALAAARIDSIVAEAEDMFAGVSVSRYARRFGFDFEGENQEGFRAAVRKLLNDEVLPRHLAFLEKLLTASSTGWLANTPRPSIADFVFVPRLQWLASGANDGLSRDILEPYPAVKAMMAKLMALPEVVAWYEKNPPAPQ